MGIDEHRTSTLVTARRLAFVGTSCPGTYALLITAINATGAKSRPVSLAFTIVK